jgi:cystathionine beta-lyase
LPDSAPRPDSSCPEILRRRRTSAELTPAELERVGISPGLVRLSVGIEDEDADDLLEDLDHALAPAEV